MEFSRRGFLQLLGIGSVGLAVSERPALALFGSDEEKPAAGRLHTPDQNLVGRHHVVQAKRSLEKLPEAEKAAWDKKHAVTGVRVVGRVPRFREPRRFLNRRTGEISSVVRFSNEEASVRDGHASFYLASFDVREKFSRFSKETLDQTFPEKDEGSFLRKQVSLVTIINSPIHARPFLEGPRELDRGFEVAATFLQFAILGDMPKNEIETFESYSQTGEYPLSIPKDIEMGLLMKMDKEIISEDIRSLDRLANFFRNRRPFV